MKLIHISPIQRNCVGHSCRTCRSGCTGNSCLGDDLNHGAILGTYDGPLAGPVIALEVLIGRQVVLVTKRHRRIDDRCIGALVFSVEGAYCYRLVRRHMNSLACSHLVASTDVGVEVSHFVGHVALGRYSNGCECC